MSFEHALGTHLCAQSQVGLSVALGDLFEDVSTCSRGVWVVGRATGGTRVPFVIENESTYQ